MRVKQVVHFSALVLLSLLIVHRLVSTALYSQTRVETDSLPTWLSRLHKSVWIFYLGPWGNPVINSDWGFWRFPQHGHSNQFYEPPYQIASQLFPSLGLYSSHDPSVLRHHCYLIHNCGIDAIILEWPGSPEREPPGILGNTHFVDQTLKLLLDAAIEFNLKVGIQIQGYQDRTGATIITDVEYFHKTYGNHSSLLKVDGKPVILIYDAHVVENLDQAINYLTLHFPSFFLACFCDKAHVYEALEKGFQGVVTFFASENRVWGSNVSNWEFLARDSLDRDLLFIPTVGPGYSERRQNPWAGNIERSRNNGTYYQRMWQAAINANPLIVAINSFNDWYEGSAIEPVLQRDDFRWNANNWMESGTSNSYLDITKQRVEEYKRYIPTPTLEME